MTPDTESTQSSRAPRLMTPKEAASATTLCMPLIRSMADAGEFPKPMKLGQKRIAYVRSEVEAWIDERIASRIKH